MGRDPLANHPVVSPEQWLAARTALLAKEKAFTRARDDAAEYVAGAFMAVLTWWLNQGAKTPPQEVDAIVRRPVMKGLGAELR